MNKKLLLAFAGCALLSCSPTNPKLEEKLFGEQVNSKGVTLDFNPKVDILFVVDDSGSMSSYQTQLSKNVEVLLKSIDKNQVIDYHLGVITSNWPQDSWGGVVNYGGRLVGGTGPHFVDRSTPGGVAMLKQYLVVGTNGSGQEQFFQPIQAALSAPLTTTENAGFLRADASLVIIFLTDTDDQSLDPNTGYDFPVADMYNFLIGLKNGDAKKILPYGVIIPSTVTESRDCSRSGESIPFKLEDLIKRFKGYEYSLCDNNYNANLDFLGKDIVSRISRILYLNRRPVPSTISVKYGSQVIPNDLNKGWTYDPSRNAIVFGQALLESLSGTSSKMDVTYTAVPL